MSFDGINTPPVLNPGNSQSCDTPGDSGWLYSFAFRSMWYMCSLALVIAGIRTMRAEWDHPEKWWALIPITLGAPGFFFAARRIFVFTLVPFRLVRSRCLRCGVNVHGVISETCPSCGKNPFRPW